MPFQAGGDACGRVGKVGYNQPMQMDYLPQALWVSTPEGLKQLAALLAHQPIVAVDTESNSLFAYQQRVCLIQFSICGEDFLLDALSLDDLQPLADVFANPDILKIFHAGDYDLDCLQRDYHFAFANLFDTMIAARTLGYAGLGLANLLEVHFGIHTNKKYQRADWGQRPLPADMMAYAQMDTHYLIPLYHQLKADLISVDRLDLAQEDFYRLCNHTHNVAADDAAFWRIRGVKDLNLRQLTVMRSLYDFRQEMAESNDRPPFKILSNNALLEVAQTLPKYYEELQLLPSMSVRQVARYGKGLMQAVKTGLKRPAITPPDVKWMKHERVKRRDVLMEWRKRIAAKMKVQSDVIMPRDLLVHIADQNPQTLEALAALMNDVPGRFTRFGTMILDVLKGSGS